MQRVCVLLTGAQTQRTLAQLHHLSAHHTIPTQLVHQHHLPGHQCASATILLGHILW